MPFTNPPNSPINPFSNSSPFSRNRNASESTSSGWVLGSPFSQANQTHLNNAKNPFNSFQAMTQKPQDPEYDPSPPDIEMADVYNTTDPDGMDWESDIQSSMPIENDGHGFKNYFTFQPIIHSSHRSQWGKSNNTNRFNRAFGSRAANDKQRRRQSHPYKWIYQQETPLEEFSDMMEVDKPQQTPQTVLTNDDIQMSEPDQGQNFYISPLQASLGSPFILAASSPFATKQTMEDEDDPMEGMGFDQEEVYTFQ
ncbi:hypothetical protein F5Y02DRAFT_422664 [Annulohypoxylon stygium]|nr:hypothetical protein F5Y02DRAFT_422664 [Annulohypoxylon stygium]